MIEKYGIWNIWYYNNFSDTKALTYLQGNDVWPILLHGNKLGLYDNFPWLFGVGQPSHTNLLPAHITQP